MHDDDDDTVGGEVESQLKKQRCAFLPRPWVVEGESCNIRMHFYPEEALFDIPSTYAV